MICWFGEINWIKTDIRELSIWFCDKYRLHISHHYLHTSNRCELDVFMYRISWWRKASVHSTEHSLVIQPISKKWLFLNVTRSIFLKIVLSFAIPKEFTTYCRWNISLFPWITLVILTTHRAKYNCMFYLIIYICWNIFIF